MAHQRTVAAGKGLLLAAVAELTEVGGGSVRWALGQLELSPATYYQWKHRAEKGRLEDQVGRSLREQGVLPEEEAAVVAYAKEHPRDGYRRLAWQMVDGDVVYLTPSAVYRVLDRHDLLYRWKRGSPSSGKKPKEAEWPDEVWHTDLMYLWVKGRWYFLVSVLDSYSRYIVAWELALTMRADEVVDVVHRALEERAGTRPRIVRDNGSQFVAKEWRDLVARFGLVDIATRVRHPESNGRIERYHRGVREEGLADADPESLYEAKAMIAEWVDYYNHRRLHAGLGYLRPVDYYQGNPEALLAERKRKLAEAARSRTEIHALSVAVQDGHCVSTPAEVSPLLCSRI